MQPDGNGKTPLISRLRLRCGVIALLLIVTFIYGIMSVCDFKRAQVQHRVVEQLRQREFGVTFDWQWDPLTKSSRRPSFLRSFVGEDFFANVVIVSGLTVSDDDLAVISNLPLLVELDVLATTKVTDKGLAEIGKLKEIQRLPMLISEEITDEGITCLTGLNKLQQISVSGNITDNGLAKLATMQSLQSIEVYSPHITDSGVLHFRQSVHLQKLYLSGGFVSGEAIRTLQEANPGLEIHYRPKR